VSGPVLDRLDLQIEVPAQTSQELLAAAAGESSTFVRERVLAARRRQHERGVLKTRLSNAPMRQYCALDAGGRRLIADAVDRGGMSARAVHRALRVARTITDLAGEEHVTPNADRGGAPIRRIRGTAGRERLVHTLPQVNCRLTSQ